MKRLEFIKASDAILANSETTNNDLRSELQIKALDQNERFDRMNVGEKALLHNYRKTNLKKLAVFTPLPPIKTGIAVYMENLLPDLTDYYDCDLYIDDKYGQDVPKLK